MSNVMYKVIKTTEQYFEYCNILEGLVSLQDKCMEHNDAIELLTLLIEKWDEDNNTFDDANPIELLHYLMEANKLKSVDMAKILGVSKSLFSDVLHYRRGLSKSIIRKLSEQFKVSQALFNKPYKLISPINVHLKNAAVMNTEKNLSVA